MKKIIAFLIALLLTGALVLFCVSFIGQQVIAPAMSENGAQVSDAVIHEQQKLVKERVTELANLYGFEAEPVLSLIGEETLRDLNSQASRWWSTLVQDGAVGDKPGWDTDEIEQVIRDDAHLNAMDDRNRAESLALAGAESVSNSIIRMVLPIRLETIRLGMQKVEKKVDVINLINFFMGVPWAVLALCILLAGLIMLLKSRKFNKSKQYIGSALGGAALVMIVLVILCMCAGIQPMIREASEGLAIQYRSVISGALFRAAGLIAAMTAGCILCLIRSQKNGEAA